MSQQQTLEQQRAGKAWEAVTRAKGQSQSYQSKYQSLAGSAPTYIQTNGLGQTLAFWRAKGKHRATDEHEALYRDVSEWVRGQLKVTQPDLLEWVMGKASTDEYRRATTETVAFLNWLKRFAEAELGDGGK